MKALVRLVAERPRTILSVTIGYGSRLAADTQGLCTFGAAAILGELACLTTALVLMPAVIGPVDRRAA